MDLADEFLRRSRERKVGFVPVGVAQGWSPQSYAHSVQCLQRMGYERIGLGGMVPLKTGQILKSLLAIAAIRAPATRLHLFGVTRTEQVREFARCGVTSFDSTSPFRQAFKDMTDNYYTPDRTYVALRVPQVEGNATLKRRILSGEVSQSEAMKLETACLKALRAVDKHDGAEQEALDQLMAYERLLDSGKEEHRDAYAEVLEHKPWRLCVCAICRQNGIDVITFRGSERNKRRGFHNVFVFNNRLSDRLAENSRHDGQLVLSLSEASTSGT